MFHRHQLTQKTREMIDSVTRDLQILGRVDGGSSSENVHHNFLPALLFLGSRDD